MDQPATGTRPDWGAGHYERTADLLLPAAEVLVGLAAVRPGERVLDVGCGTGNAALLAAAAGAAVIAVDPSERLLCVAGSAALDRRLDLRCRAGEVADLPVPDASADCLLSNFGIVFAPDPEAAAAETARVLAPGGRMLFTAWIPGGAVGALARAAEELVRDALGAPPAPPGFPWHEEAAVGGLLSGHGFAVDRAGAGEIVFTAASPQAYLDVEAANHPLAVAAFDVLQRLGRAAEARDRLLSVLDEGNEDRAAFRSTGRYVVLAARRS